MSQPGFGVMIGMLSGSEDTITSLHSALNKQIASITITDSELTLQFSDGSKLKVFDGGQSCCEHRYMKCDDNLADYVGSTFRGMELRDAPNEVDDWGEVHEVPFLYVNTSSGPFSVANHNEHNGYYGGFWIKLDYEPSAA